MARASNSELNKYFVSLATNLNKAYNELGELSIDNLPSFTDYLPRTNLSSIYLSDCTLEEIQKIISEFQKGKSSDIPIHTVVKKSSLTICPEVPSSNPGINNTSDFSIRDPLSLPSCDWYRIYLAMWWNSSVGRAADLIYTCQVRCHGFDSRCFPHI